MAAETPLPLIESLLIVDDSAVQRQHTAMLARECGITLIYEAGNGNEALELLAMLTLPPNLMIIDLEMPGMDGVELIQQLQQRGIDIPFVVASSREGALINSVETMTHALGLAVLGALQKPLSLAQLRTAFSRYDRAPGKSFAQTMDVLTPVSPAELEQAIKSGDIVPYFQPKVDMRTGMIKGVEALARWHHPSLGMIPPDRFIPLAEQEGLIYALTLAITEKSLAQAAAWNKRGLRLSVAINLSPRLLDSTSFVPEVSDMLDQHALPADQVVWEITESSVVANLGMALGTLARLRLKGFGLSIDDYGTGFSSMQQLARIPFTELKIDRSFVHGAHERHHLRVILQSALDMASRLDLVSVAEGIETLDDWRLLQDSGCALGQGFLIAKPMPAEELPQWLKGHHRNLRELRGAHALPRFNNR
ncbi:EAL domain, c-di-GMP-specific phosphodiesterase class I (or its enzymatically inactive variant) [Andreprevotia lacus DSM 23236]|jgi:EAL domain-containing protein (putative c-di-GMP-specific phosphodiesterase class I)/ActR/RegA family two-component response regulator|uniref:EAL domain, c-di-GMP-specific phosphodiesterase class I (Or its enzymatically inactive variant) n=1 Tax=Andreprevotia lacus DSM 23236 TaxID=1121001 RepID=A0A1W1X2E1_9NEIS|nr:EAL domain-containing response regulator [Andreprevotia lacus]SMC18112.1 EAL domain, c-di-GMP-specific phosphodiesterase class I (or its enzymatically inactive variant) [Andreprevotia lacus DSM 23236]